ncbi:MAG TPA: putative glycoside hydrolase [Gaiellaceae bacterium]|nr:putative glycoside hydrolase [Gaiellaceae bacterium]
MATVTSIELDARQDELRELRRRLRRQQVLRRRLAALGIVAALIALGIGIGRVLGNVGVGSVSLSPAAVALPASPYHARLPVEMRGVHVTMNLASLPGKLADYVALRKQGLNTLELDVKDENGHVGFTGGVPEIARADGAAAPYYDPAKVVRQAHAAGLYLIGRVVTFEDPTTAAAHPELAIHMADGSLWHTAGGLAWLNPYSRKAWAYDVGVAVAAAKAGFDEIQFDYVRFPSDGDLSLIRYPGAHPQPMRETIAAFLRYAASRLHPLGVRVSADVFGLSATRDLGIGQYPGQIGQVVDAIYPMTYPSHYTAGEFDLPDPNAAPGKTVAFSLRDFRSKLAGSNARLVPWLQDFSLYGRPYTAADVAAQVAAARRYQASGFMLWNAAGLYTAGALAPGPPPDLPDLARPGL